MGISIVHTTKAQPGGSTSISVTIPATTAGNCLIVAITAANFTGSGSVSAVKLGGAAGNFSQLAADDFHDTINSAWEDAIIWADPSCAGGQTAITITANAALASATTVDVVVYEVSGLAASGILDRSSANGASQPSGTGAWTSGATAATTTASELWLGAAYADGGLNPPSAPWTDSGINALDAGAAVGAQIVSATGTATYSGTVQSPTGYAAAVVTLAAAAGAGVSGAVQPAATVPAPRRRARRGQWQHVTGPAFVKVPAPVQEPTPAPRRKPARAWVRFVPVATVNTVPSAPVAGTVQPASARPAPRRRPVRASLRFIPVTTVNAIPGGTVQPQPTAPVPRRRPARALARGLAAPGARIPAPRQLFQMPPRRRRARALVQFAPVPGSNAIAPRTLLISMASAAGVDDYGNPYPQGIFAGAGVIEGPTFVGSDYLSNTAGSFYYSGAPAFGNLISSVAAAAGTDAQGNAYLAGTVSYLPGGTYSAVAITGGAVAWFTAPDASGPWSEAGVMEIALTSGNPLVFSFDALAGNINIPQPTIGAVSTDPNSGTTWVSGERALLNTWANAINNIISALRTAGITL